MSTPERVEKILDESIREALAKGYELVRECWGIPAESSCCALSSLVAVGRVPEFEVVLDTDDMPRYAAELGCSADECHSLVRGFDGVSMDEGDDVFEPSQEFYEVGQRLREKYLNGSGPNVQS